MWDNPYWAYDAGYWDGYDGLLPLPKWKFYYMADYIDYMDGYLDGDSDYVYDYG